MQLNTQPLCNQQVITAHPIVNVCLRFSLGGRGVRGGGNSGRSGRSVRAHRVRLLRTVAASRAAVVETQRRCGDWARGASVIDRSVHRGRHVLCTHACRPVDRE